MPNRRCFTAIQRPGSPLNSLIQKRFSSHSRTELLAIVTIQQPIPNYLGRRTQRRLLWAVLGLGLVVIAVAEAARPANWHWLWHHGAADVAQAEPGLDRGDQIDTRVVPPEPLPVPEPPLLPSDPAARARVQAAAHSIAMDIHPICNLRVVAHVGQLLDGGDEARVAWMRHFIGPGLEAFESLLAEAGTTGPFCFGEQPTIADCCLIPQLYNAERWGVGYRHLERIVAAEGSELPVGVITALLGGPFFLWLLLTRRRGIID